MTKKSKPFYLQALVLLTCGLEKTVSASNSYNPDRHLKIAHKLAPELAASSHFDERDHYTYGVGRRICPGFHLAERVQWRIIAQLLWAFRIEPLEELSVEPEMWDECFSATLCEEKSNQ